MSRFFKSYQLAPNCPPPMSWDDYSQKVQAEWGALLNSSQGEEESPIQAFLETHPCMVPGAQSMSGPSGHSAFPAALIRQPKLPGFSHKFPDFMWIAMNSAMIYAVLIEIEAPKKKWFNRDGTPTAQFTQARNQLTEWRAWFHEPVNQQSFLTHYNPPYQRERRLVPEFVLIYGRRAEFRGKPQLTKKRAAEHREDEHIMTFDRLEPIFVSAQYMTVASKEEGYRAVSIPATVELGPAFSEYRAMISGKEQCMAKSPFMTDERKDFLANRFAYWDAYAQTEGLRFKNYGDRE